MIAENPKNTPNPFLEEGRIPSSRQEYWVPKLTRNKERDAAPLAQLQMAGWHPIIIWECELADMAKLERKLPALLS